MGVVTNVEHCRFAAALGQAKAALPDKQYEVCLSRLIKMAEFAENWKQAHPEGISQFGDQNAVRIISSAGHEARCVC